MGLLDFLLGDDSSSNNGRNHDRSVFDTDSCRYHCCGICLNRIHCGPNHDLNQNLKRNYCLRVRNLRVPWLLNLIFGYKYKRWLCQGEAQVKVVVLFVMIF